MSTAAPSRDILRIFPYEIWSRCILFTIDRVPDGPLLFLSVSSHWQRLLLDSPIMWSYIHLGDGEDTIARVHTFLHLSGQHPLELATPLSGPIWRVMKSTILFHSKRVYSVSVLMTGTAINKGRELLGTANWPALRIISSPNMIFSPSKWERLFTSCPNMQYYKCILFTNDGCRWLGENTREARVNLFNITPRLGEFGRRFLRLPRLEKINLSIRSSNSSEQSKDTSHTFVLHSKSLRHLGLSTHYSRVAEGLFRSPLGLLNSMEITIPPKLLHLVIKALASLPSLQRWHLSLEHDENEWSTPPLKREYVPQLCDFSLTLNDPLRVTVEKVFNVLGYDDALCQVGTAEFSIAKYTTHPTELATIHMLLCLVRNARRLHFLDFLPVKATSQKGTPRGATIKMPNLTELYIGYTALLVPIEAPRLLMLGIPLRGNDENPPLELPEQFGQSVVKLKIRWEDFDKLKIKSHNPWSSVQNVQWTGFNPSAGSSTTSFQSIISVEFKGDCYFHHRPDSAINLFLIGLIRHPSACPNLRILKSGQYPLWELLFEALNQRNQDKDVTRLEEIQLPAFPAKPLLSLVVKVLSDDSGGLPPKNIDHALLRRFQEPLIDACSFCISAGYIYCAWDSRLPSSDTLYSWWQDKEDESQHDRGNPDVRPGLSWMEWEERLAEASIGWVQFPKGITRKDYCLRHTFGAMERISKYTLEGTE